MTSVNGLKAIECTCIYVPLHKRGEARDIDFLAAADVKSVLDDLVSTYGSMSARDLELRATIVYVERDLRAKNESCTKAEIVHIVDQIKPRYFLQEIEQVLDELWQRKHIRINY